MEPMNDWKSYDEFLRWWLPLDAERKRDIVRDDARRTLESGAVRLGQVRQGFDGAGIFGIVTQCDDKGYSLLALGIGGHDGCSSTCAFPIEWAMRYSFPRVVEEPTASGIRSLYAQLARGRDGRGYLHTPKSSGRNSAVDLVAEWPPSEWR